MGCTNPQRREAGAPHHYPLSSRARYLIYADVRLRIPMTHHIPKGASVGPQYRLESNVLVRTHVHHVRACVRVFYLIKD